MKYSLRFGLFGVLLGVLLILAAAPDMARAQSPAALTPAIRIANGYRTTANVTYLTVDGNDLKLDVYQSSAATTPNKTLVWIHGGNWVGGSKEASLLSLLPFFQMGWNVVNVDYRLLDVAPAPAAVEDSRCAVRWVIEHAKDYNIDPARMVVSGNSAGGQLALMVGMAPASAGFDTRCPGQQEIRVAGVISWYGFPNLMDVLEGPNANAAVGKWIGNGPDRKDLAHRLSPISYVRAGLPPILLIHGDQDTTSPYVYAVAFHKALDKAGAVNQLVTVPNAKHGRFTNQQTETIYTAILGFLDRAHLR
jgi:acetyl esterase/lipase